MAAVSNLYHCFGNIVCSLSGRRTSATIKIDVPSQHIDIQRMLMHL